MPDGMHEFNRFQLVEDDTSGVAQPADEHEPETCRSHSLYHGDNGQNNGPAGNDVKDHRDFFKPFDADGIEDDPQNTDSPHNTEQYPTKSPVEQNQGNRGVASGNEQIDGGVVKYPKDVFCPVGSQSVVDGRHGEQDDKAEPVNGSTNDPPGVPLEGGKDDHNNRPCGCQQGAEAMGDGVGDFFAQGVAVAVFLWFAGHSCPPSAILRKRHSHVFLLQKTIAFIISFFIIVLWVQKRKHLL